MIKIIVFSAVMMSHCLLCEGSRIFDEDSRITFEPDDNFSDYFGYSVLFDSNKLIVGAPKARNRYNTSINSGQVFSCPLENLNLKKVTCHPLGENEDVEDTVFRRSTKYYDFFKNDMWFGATVASVPNGKLLMCAPRWTTPYRDKHLLANGACYMVSKKRGSALFPLTEMSRQAFMTHGERIEYGEYGTHLNLYAYGQAGFSIKVSKNNIIMGAPGLLQWTGGIATFKYYKESEYLSLQPTINPYYTLDVGPDDYLGYSVESGVFEKNGTTLYVAGAPRSKSGYGQVLIFEPSFQEKESYKIREKVTGPQLGAYFGASLCCIDVNGDGISDLLVGAPNFVRTDGDGLHYDQGAVFVYLTETKETHFSLIAADYVTGSGKSGVRFGSTIANLGDIDGDGFNDIAVGSPWEDDGKGAVFIFKGAKDGLRTKFVQKIVVEDAKTFGISISGAYDINNDKCNDLAIGAHSTGAAYVFRCIPTMRVEVFIKVPDAVNLQQGATNFSALFCVKAAESKTWPHAKTDFTANIVIDPIENRASIKGDTEYDVSIKPGDENCDEQTIEVKPTADLSKPISMKFNLEEDLGGDSESHEQVAKVSDDSVLESSFHIQLMRDCGDDEDLICKPFLIMKLKPLSSPYVPGAKDKLGFKLSVVNMEEPSFGAKVHLTLPSSPKRLPRECSLVELNVTCDVPSPLNRNETVEWEIELEYAYKDTTEKELKIIANLYDPFYNDTDIDRISKELVILIAPKANFLISGKALPNATIAVTRDKFNEAANVTFVHYFEVTNFGPSDWFRLPVLIILPDKVNLSSRIKGCAEDGSQCEWNIPAKVSVPVLLSLRYNLADHGDFLEQQKVINITTSMIIQLEAQNKSAFITTTLILEPAPPLWPIILGCVAGLLLLSLIVLGLYKYGFFSRNRLEDFKRLQEQNVTLDEANTSADDGLSSTPEVSSQEFILDESD